MEDIENGKKPFNFKSEFFDWIEAIVFALVTVVVIFTFIFRIVIVSGDSMLPTLHDEDRLILNSSFYNPKAGDIIVVAKENVNNGKPIIKRIIALEGQTVDIDYQNQLVIVDGKAHKEDYINNRDEEGNKIELEPRGNMKLPATVPEGCVFVMGDNRNHSLDSRTTSVGMIELNEIKGHAVWRLFPIKKFGKVD